ncbi:MAG: DUF983 domain-containing protein [Chloroflexota bacterium]
MRRILAVLLFRCPHCLQGKVFAGLWRMHTDCPVCEIHFEREDGYFMMSVFIGYVISAVLAVPFIVGCYLLHAPVWGYVGGSVVLLTLLLPLIFRYSRVIWLHLDELFDPRPQGEH